MGQRGRISSTQSVRRRSNRLEKLDIQKAETSQTSNKLLNDSGNGRKRRKGSTRGRKKKSLNTTLSNEEFFAEEALGHIRIDQLEDHDHLHIYGLETIAFKIRWRGYGTDDDSWEPFITVCKVDCVCEYIRKYLIPTIGRVTHFDKDLEEVVSYEFVEPQFIEHEDPGYYMSYIVNELDEFGPSPRTSPVLRMEKPKAQEQPKKKRRKRGPQLYRKFVPSRDGLNAFNIPAEASDDDALYGDPVSINSAIDSLETVNTFDNDNWMENAPNSELVEDSLLTQEDLKTTTTSIDQIGSYITNDDLVTFDNEGLFNEDDPDDWIKW